jgi:hypothetical protein
MCDTYNDEKILEYLLERMSEEECARFERHVSECSSCRESLEELRPVADFAGVSGDGAGPELHSRLRESVSGLAKRRRESGPKAASPRRRRLFWTVVSAAACLTIVAGSLAYNYYQSLRFAERVVARVDEASRGVSIRRNGRVVIAVVGMPLAVGDGIETGDGQSVSFTYQGEETRVMLESGSILRLERTEKGKRLILDRGRIEAMVSPQPEGKPMAVVTPHAEMAVLGTVFSVSASEHTTGLSVTDGTVRMSLPGKGSYEDVSEGRIALAKRGADRVLMPGKLVRTMRITGLPGAVKITGIAVADGNVWVHGSRGETRAPVLASLDPATGGLLREIIPEEPFRPGSCLTWNNGLLWGFSRDGTRLVGIDVATGRTSRSFSLPAEVTSSLRTFDLEGGVGWLRGSERKELVKIDLDRGIVLDRIRCPFGIDRIAASENAVYAAERGWNACRIDPGKVRVVYPFMCESASYTGDMALDDEGRLWTIAGTEPVIHVLEAE